MKNKILLLGSQGNLGLKLHECLSKTDMNTYAFSRNDLDFTSYDSVNELIKTCKPDYIINCAAYTKVDKAEQSIQESYDGNVLIIKNIALASQKSPAKIITFSTDYVFDGLKNSPYKETDKINPLMVYGHHKAEAEMFLQNNHDNYLIFRVSWLFSWLGTNFLTRILNLSETNQSLEIISDQYGTPTSTRMLAEVLTCLLKKNDFKASPSNIFHLTNSGIASWYDLALHILYLAKPEYNCYPIKASERKSLTARPTFTPLDKTAFEKYFTIRLPHWFESMEKEYKTLNN